MDILSFLIKTKLNLYLKTHLYTLIMIYMTILFYFNRSIKVSKSKRQKHSWNVTETGNLVKERERLFTDERSSA